MIKYHRQWYLKNRKRILVEQKTKPGRAEYQKKYSAVYRIKNKEYLAQQKKSYYLKNKDHIAIYKKEYAKTHKNIITKYRKAWTKKDYAKNPTKALLKYHARRAETTNKIISKDIYNWKSKICGICNTLIEGKFHIDHRIPLIKGGSHTLDNLQLAHPICNMIKHDHLISLIPLRDAAKSKSLAINSA